MRTHPLLRSRRPTGRGRALLGALTIAGLLLLAPPAAPAAGLPPAPRAPFAASAAVVAVPDEPEVRISVGDRDRRARIVGGRFVPIMTSKGVLFRLRARNAERVEIVGSFNDWTPAPMEARDRGRWRVVVPLEPGEFEYAFVIDGVWALDPDNPIRRDGLTRGDGLEEVSVVRVRHDEVISPVAPGSREVSLGLRPSYDRVDQLTLRGTLDYRNRANLNPDLRLTAGYSFGRERGVFEVSATQPLFRPRFFDLGASVYRITETRDRERMSDLENSLAAFVGRQDWRDYFEADGVTLFGRAYLEPLGEFTVRWRREDHLSVEKTTDWGLLFPDTDMRDNPQVSDGQFRSLSLEWERDTRNDDQNPTRGGLMAAHWKWTGGERGGDYEYESGWFDVRRYLSVTPGQWVDVRLTGGLLRNARRAFHDGGLPEKGFAALPHQELFYLGGVGTMRATQFKSIVGDRMLLANVEMRVEIVTDVQLAFFVDAGDAWIDAEDELRWNVDGGLGIQDGDANLRLQVATKLDDREGEVIFSGRIRRMF